MELPNRPAYTENAFRKYEDTINQFVRIIPTPSTIDPRPLTAETFSHRLRDAIKAYGFSVWNSPINRDSLRKTFRLFGEGGTWVINTDGELITVGPQKSSATLSPRVSPLDILGTYKDDVIDGSSTDICRALLVLLDREIITGPIKLKDVKGYFDGIKDAYPNVEFIEEGDLTILL